MRRSLAVCMQLMDTSYTSLYVGISLTYDQQRTSTVARGREQRQAALTLKTEAGDLKRVSNEDDRQRRNKVRRVSPIASLVVGPGRAKLMCL